MSRKTCVGFVGTGGIAQRHFEALEKRDDVELVGFCDVNEELAKKVSDRYGGNHFTSSIVMHESVQLDCVFICVPPFAHGEAEKSAIERGVPFLIEKPINMHLSQAEEIAAAVAEANLLTSVGYMNRYRAEFWGHLTKLLPRPSPGAPCLCPPPVVDPSSSLCVLCGSPPPPSSTDH
jgi:predicted dehydrogenase